MTTRLFIHIIGKRIMQLKGTKKQYEIYLDSMSPEQGSDLWIIGGKVRMSHMWRSAYGEAIRKFDPIAFEVGYNEWKNK